MEEKQIISYLEMRRENLLSMKDLRNTASDGFGIADNLMKHAALFEIEQAIRHIDNFNRTIGTK